mmetsp:Transcript_33701/g.99084  ORF Transcript_33701/g.99084 Transcript_33701/m.99084 type:complete len:120 (-) Transcript_33701:123-482(-)
MKQISSTVVPDIVGDWDPPGMSIHVGSEGPGNTSVSIRYFYSTVENGMYTDATPAVRSTIVQSLWDQDMGQRGYKSSLPMPQALPGPMGGKVLVNRDNDKAMENAIKGGSTTGVKKLMY